jgi:predicted dehydrogenase
VNRPLRLALIGAGGIGHAYAEATRRVDDVELCYIADVRPESASALAATYGVEPVVDPYELVDPDRVDLALLCTPPITHEPLAIAFLEAGVPVMCEKPLATSRASAQAILAVADRTGTMLTMASKFRFVDDITQARAALHAGHLGDVVGVEVAFSSRVDMRSRWNSDPAVAGGGVLIDNGTHAVDIVRFLLGPVESVLATTTTVTPGMQVEDTALALLRTRDGHLGTVSVAWSIDRMADRYVGVFGTEGTLEVGWQQSRLRVGNGPETRIGTGYEKIGALAANLTNTARAVLGVEDLVVTPMDAIASVAVVEAGYQSAITGTWTRVRSRMHERLAG